MTLRATGAASRPILWVGLITFAGFAIRLYFVLLEDFPLGDGGMFYAMVADLKGHGFVLPAFTSYNGGHIPFAYPPLPFYVAAGLCSLPGVRAIDVLRFLPLFVSAWTIPAFYALAVVVLKDQRKAKYAALLFAFAPVFGWLVMGGGLTRSFALLFGLITLLHFYHLITDDQQLRRAAFAGLFAGLTALSHMEIAWFTGLTCLVFLVAKGQSMRAPVAALFAAMLALVIALPWLAVVYQRHGFEPYLNARGSAPLGPVQLAIALAAVMISRRLMLPSLFAVLLVAGARNGVYAFSVAGALNLSSFCCWLLALRSQSSLARPGIGRGLKSSRVAVWFIPLALSTTVIWVGYGIMHSVYLLGHSAKPYLPTFAWISQHTPDSSRFIVLTEAKIWGEDYGAEWFPAITGRVNVATVQGSEWLGGGGGVEAVEHRRAILARCKGADVQCLEKAPVDFTHVYVVNGGCCGGIRESLSTSSHYALVLDSDLAEVYEKRLVADRQ